MSTIIKQGLTNHVTLVLDRSGSMSGKEQAVIKAVDAQISSLADMSQKMDQETRVTVVIFDDVVEVLVYDKDVLRLPSIKEYYKPRGATALVDATLKSIEDLEKIPELYSDHAYLMFVVTDGVENRSRNTPSMLERKIRTLGDNWTVAALVPDMRGEQYALKCGFPGGNILQWDTTTTAGFEQAASKIKAATSSFMQSRAAGVRGSRSVFVGGQLDATSVKMSNLKPLPTSDYQLVPVVRTNDTFTHPKNGPVVEIKKFVDHAYPPYRVGRTYYQLVKSEKVQGNKQVAVRDKKTSKVYAGSDARKLIGLPDHDVTVRPGANPEYDLFIQSSSTNRHLPLGTKVLVLTH